MKSFAIATALLLPTLAWAQGTPPQGAAPAAGAPAAARPAPAAKQPQKPAQTSPDVLDIVQVIGLRQVDPSTYEILLRLQNGKEVHLRANAFVMQNLGQVLGTYGSNPPQRR